MTILKQINDHVNQTTTENAILDGNLTRLSESSDTPDEQLNEAITHWLAKVRNAVEGGNITPQQKQNVTYVLGALIALSDPNIAAAFDEKEDLGTMLYAVSGADKADSQSAIQRLVQIGRHPSVKSYTAQAEQTLQDPQATVQLANQLQVKIDKLMRTKLSREQNKTPATEPKLGLKNELNK